MMHMIQTDKNITEENMKNTFWLHKGEMLSVYKNATWDSC